MHPLLLACCLALPLAAAQSYPVAGTGQTRCYGADGEIAAPRPGQPFWGQDAQHPGPAPSYVANGDGTVSDRVTGLTWVAARGSKLTWEAAVAGAAACRVGGHADWRMPTIKELYSLIDFTGASGRTAAASKPYLDTRFFDFAYGDEQAGERLIDCQDWSGTAYVGQTMGNNPTAFGVNFADGRIKGYPIAIPGGRIGAMYVRYVRGNPAYGANDFHANADGTVSDRATGLTWQAADSGVGIDWEHALAWAAANRLGGHADWRLPSAKELQSIVDYTRAPATGSAAIAPLFQATAIADGEFGFYWSSTTHLEGPPEHRGSAAAYVAFGRALGWMQGPRFGPPGTFRLVDVHGAGAQRSDPKAGDPAAFPHGRGPQGDVVRILNLVRLVRGPE